mmetsp:Transcript_3717/g.5933  ORF Transcript_3717/g.5933 Transcript_3717/m.5933 type:complete len:330 (-) Transcript_3717:671-1660(-)
MTVRDLGAVEAAGEGGSLVGVSASDTEASFNSSIAVIIAVSSVSFPATPDWTRVLSWLMISVHCLEVALDLCAHRSSLLMDKSDKVTGSSISSKESALRERSFATCSSRPSQSFCNWATLASAAWAFLSDETVEHQLTDVFASWSSLRNFFNSRCNSWFSCCAFKNVRLSFSSFWECFRLWAFRFSVSNRCLRDSFSICCSSPLTRTRRNSLPISSSSRCSRVSFKCWTSRLSSSMVVFSAATCFLSASSCAFLSIASCSFSSIFVFNCFTASSFFCSAWAFSWRSVPWALEFWALARANFSLMDCICFCNSASLSACRAKMDLRSVRK